MQATPRAALTTLLALLLGYGLMQMGNTLQGTLLSVRGELERFAPAHEGGARVSLRWLYQHTPFGVVAACLCGVTTSLFFTLGPVFAQGRGLDTRGIAAFMAGGTLGGFLMAWPIGQLSDRIDRRLVIVGAAVTASATLVVLMALVPDDATRWALYLCAAVIGGTIIPAESPVPVGIALVSAHSDRRT